MKISDHQRIQFAIVTKKYREAIDSIQANEEKEARDLSADRSSHNTRFDLAEDCLKIVSYYIAMYSLSVAELGVKNENYLNEGRKRTYKAIIYIEQVVSSRIDVPFSDYEGGVIAIGKVTESRRYEFIRMLGFYLDFLKSLFGVESKWKWSFVELEGRFATISKNLLNLKTLVPNLQPGKTNYRILFNHLQLCRNLLQNAANRYREKYELATYNIDDMKQAINFLAALKRIDLLVGEEDVRLVEKKIGSWKSKLESDQKK